MIGQRQRAIHPHREHDVGSDLRHYIHGILKITGAPPSARHDDRPQCRSLFSSVLPKPPRRNRFIGAVHAPYASRKPGRAYRKYRRGTLSSAAPESPMAPRNGRGWQFDAPTRREPAACLQHRGRARVGVITQEIQRIARRGCPCRKMCSRSKSERNPTIRPIIRWSTGWS